MPYDAFASDDYWSKRVQRVDPLAAVLNYGVPQYVNEAHSKWELTCILKVLADPRPHVIDVACGIGRVTIPLARVHEKVTAIDNSSGMVHTCRENVALAGFVGSVSVVKSSATDLPLEAESADAAVCLGLLEHLPTIPRQAAVEELIRVLRPGGVLILSANNEDSALLKQRVEYSRSEQFSDGEMRGFFAGFIGRKWVTEVLEQHGFAIEIVGTNTFQSAALHLLRQTKPDQDEPAPWATYFASAAELDIRYHTKGRLDLLLADEFIFRAVKEQAHV